MGKNKKDVSMGALRFIATGLMSFFITFLLGMLFTQLSSLGTWLAIANVMLIFAFGGIALWIRKGEEKVTGETLLQGLGYTALFMALDKLPWNIPYFNVVVATDWLSGTLLIFTIWMSEGVLQKIIK